MATYFGYISHLQAIIYSHLIDSDIGIPLHENVQYLSKLSDCK
jgi:hypothetical protein